jgi:hypothetical protein
MKEVGHFQNLDIAGRIVDWMYLAYGRGQWWALVKTVMIIQVPLKAGNILIGVSPFSFSRMTLPH